MANKRKQDDSLAALLETVSKAKLVDLLVRVASTRPAVRCECLDYLNRHTALSPSRKKQAEGEKLLALWAELAPDLDELDAYGGGDYDADIHVSSLLQEIAQALSRKSIDAGYRQQLLDNALPYIESGNAGLDDDLYDLAYAACYTKDDWRALAEAFETMGGNWNIDHARRIYRRLGDREKYLELRQRKLVTGTDYFDLADFHWKAGEKQKAMEVAETGLLKGKGRMDELRQFVAKRAKSVGNRERYLALQFDQAIDPLTCDKYKAFRKLCTPTEWKHYEAKILARLENARKAQVMSKIHCVMVEVLRDPSRWRDFALKVKKDNIKRPAFQEEFTKAISGWQALQ